MKLPRSVARTSSRLCRGFLIRTRSSYFTEPGWLEARDTADKEICATDRIDVSEVAAGPGPEQLFKSVTAIQIFYEGNVQGVGFRYSVRHIANGFDVTGFVRNLHDGRVELQAAGEAEEVRAFIDAIGQSELRSHIKKQSETSLANSPPFRGFEIRYD